MNSNHVTPLATSLVLDNLTISDYFFDEKGASLEVRLPPYDGTIMICPFLATAGSIRWLIGRGLSFDDLDADGSSPLDYAEIAYKLFGLKVQLTGDHRKLLEFLRSDSLRRAR